MSRTYIITGIRNKKTYASIIYNTCLLVYNEKQVFVFYAKKN
jgi:hypothetical protein